MYVQIPAIVLHPAPKLGERHAPQPVCILRGQVIFWSPQPASRTLPRPIQYKSSQHRLESRVSRRKAERLARYQKEVSEKIAQQHLNPIYNVRADKSLKIITGNSAEATKYAIELTQKDPEPDTHIMWVGLAAGEMTPWYLGVLLERQEGPRRWHQTALVMDGYSPIDASLIVIHLALQQTIAQDLRNTALTVFVYAVEPLDAIGMLRATKANSHQAKILGAIFACAERLHQDSVKVELRWVPDDPRLDMGIYASPVFETAENRALENKFGARQRKPLYVVMPTKRGDSPGEMEDLGQEEKAGR